MSVVPIQQRLGPIFAAVVCSFFTYGVVVTKTYDYFTKYVRDPWGFKVVVAASVGLDLANTASWGAWGYEWMVGHYGDTDYIAKIPKVWLSAHLGLGLNCLLVESFLAWRLFMLAGGWPSKPLSFAIPTVVVGTAIAGEVFNLKITIETFVNDSFVHLHKISWIGIYWGSLTAASDIIITFALGYHLIWKQRHTSESWEPQFMATNASSLFRMSAAQATTRSWIKGIMYRAIQVNFIIMICQIVFFIGLFDIPGSWYMCIAATLPQLYTFSLLISLTARPVRQKEEDVSQSFNSKLAKAAKAPKVTDPTQSNYAVDPTESVPNDENLAIYDIALLENGRKVDTV